MEDYTIERIADELPYYHNRDIESLLPTDGDPYSGYIKTKLNEESVLIKVDISTDFPHKLPMFTDIERKFTGLPHILFNEICYYQQDSLIINPQDPTKVFIDAFEMAMKTIKDGLSGINFTDYYVEFEEIWKSSGRLVNKQFGIVSADLNVNDTSVRTIDLISIENNQFIATESLDEIDKETSIPLEQIFNKDLKRIKKRRGKYFRTLYLPLETSIKPPAEDSFWSYDEIKSILLRRIRQKDITKIKRDMVIEARAAEQTIVDLVIVSIPTVNDERAFFGLILKGIKEKKAFYGKNVFHHSLFDKPKNLEIHKLIVYNWSTDYLLKRTSGSIGMQNKNVLVVGAGSVGSEVILKLAKGGVGKITIVDNDYFSRDNVLRHRLGFDSVINKENIFPETNFKVDKIADECRSKYPHTIIDPHSITFEEYLNKEKTIIKDYDLIIFAIGSPNTELEISKRLRSENNVVPHIHSWLEPLDIGGHVLVSGNNNASGCYNCIFESSKEGHLINKISFSSSGQNFIRKITGCGSAFTPYSFLDSERIAIATVDAAIKLLSGTIVDNPLFSVKGEGDIFFSQQFRATERYLNNTQEQLKQDCLSYKADSCPVCTDMRKG
ncbi:ThiF family adenylyltransferase [Terribacillus saccharophilus]|uniref:ThiF family adenylyltransferase n=1 Tax=Terribacillus saccharophilus TaxID=361277 RepID=UPI003981CA80